ncbi:MAG: T9SS type A sorting domain-containing protein, partial [Bacteroidia bacterium]|nr:T9SS type A sorting domain-containing protein [Bacteroidia bacterium]
YFVVGILNGCTSRTSSVEVIVNRSPVGLMAGNNGPLCEGQQLVLTASSISGARYTWSGPNGFSSTLQSPVISEVAQNYGGVYSVVAWVGGCTSNVALTEVVVNRSPGRISAWSNGPLCAGERLVLGASSVSGALYRWLGPSNFISAEQTPVIAVVGTQHSGMYSVVAVIGNCTSTAQVDVEVRDIPRGVRASHNGPVCSGGILNLQAPLIEGARYFWQGPAGFVSTEVNPSIVAVSTAHSGIYSLLVELGGCTARTQTTEVRVVGSTRVIVAGNNGPLCEGQVLQLTANTVVGANYYWSGPNNYVSREQNPVLGPVSSLERGVYSVVAVIDGCTSEVAQTWVEVRKNPGVGNFEVNSPVCVGGTLRLVAPLVEGGTYIWQGPIGVGSRERITEVIGVTTSHSGVYSLQVVVAGCTSEVVSREVMIRPCADSCPTPLSLRSAVSPSGEVRLEWNISGNGKTPVCYVVRYGELGVPEREWQAMLVPGRELSVVLSNLVSGKEYGFRVQGNCSLCSVTSGDRSGWSNVHNFKIGSSRVGWGESENAFELYPNPTNGIIEVKWENDSHGGVGLLRIFSLEGTEVKRGEYEVSAGENRWWVDIADLPAGIYLVDWEWKDERYRVKIIKQ